MPASLGRPKRPAENLGPKRRRESLSLRHKQQRRRAILATLAQPSRGESRSHEARKISGRRTHVRRQTSNGACEHRPSDGPFRQIDNDGRAAEATATTPRRAENAACQWIPVLIWRTRVSPDLDRYSAGNCEGIEGFAHLSEPPRDPRHRFAHFLGRTRVGKTDELMAVNRIEVDAGGGRDARLFQHLLGKLETV